MTWLLLVLAAIVQEGLLVNGAILLAISQHVSWWVIHAFFIVGTIVDILVPYYLVSWGEKRIAGNKWGQKLINWSESQSKWIKRFGEIKGLVILGLLNYIYLDAAIAAFWKIDIKKTFVVLVISNLLWYASLILLLTGFKQACLSYGVFTFPC